MFWTNVDIRTIHFDCMGLDKVICRVRITLWFYPLAAASVSQNYFCHIRVMVMRAIMHAPTCLWLSLSPDLTASLHVNASDLARNSLTRDHRDVQTEPGPRIHAARDAPAKHARP